MNNLDLDPINAQKAYLNASSEGRKLLVNLYPKFNFNSEITDLATSYEAGCDLIDYTPRTLSDFDFLPEWSRESAFAGHQLDVIARALNGKDFEFDYSDDSQKKWFVYCVWNEQRAGGPGFSFGDVVCNISFSCVGARHSFKSEKLARFAGTHFESLFNQFLKPYRK